MRRILHTSVLPASILSLFLLTSSCIPLLQYLDEEYGSAKEKENTEALALLSAMGQGFGCTAPSEAPQLEYVGPGQGGWVLHFASGVSGATSYVVFSRDTFPTTTEWQVLSVFTAQDFESYAGNVPLGEVSFGELMVRAAVGSCLGPASNVVDGGA